MPQSLIQIHQISKSIGPLLLFDSLSLAINQGERFALIGENGAGKTTLLKILMREIRPDSGSVVCSSELSIGYLPQEIAAPDSQISARHYIEEGTLTQLEKEMAHCLEENRITAWSELHERYERLGGYRRVPLEQVLNGLKLESSLLDFPVAELSSGQKVRVALAKALYHNPDLLLLDEPTNHLDSEMLGWLKTALEKREGATIIVSHDRKFINEVCNCLIEIKEGKLDEYQGNYDDYLQEQKRILEKKLKEYETQKEEIKHLKQQIKALTFSRKQAPPPSDRNIMAYDRWGEHHQKSLQRNLNQLKSKLEELESHPLSHPKPKTIKGIHFNPPPLNSAVAVELKEVSKAFGKKSVLSHLNKIIKRGERLVLTGPNGSGKTTLLKLIAKQLQVDCGEILYAPTAKIAYLDQECEMLPLDETPLQYFERRFSLNEESLRRQLHKAALGDALLLHRRFSSMSLGQRKRFQLLSLILEKPNVLLLDEPTNHLDLLTLEALESELLDFKGTVLAVSHDATFIKKIATETWKF